MEPWFNLPGTASILIPKEGTAQQCNTSVAVTISLICILIGKTMGLSTSNKRN
jgi:hypothetical protein